LEAACGRPGLFDDILNDDSCLLIGNIDDLPRKKELWWEGLDEHAQGHYMNGTKGRNQPCQYTQEERIRGGTSSMASKGANDEGKNVHAVEMRKRSVEVMNAFRQLKHQLASKNQRGEIVFTQCGHRTSKFLTEMCVRVGNGNNPNALKFVSPLVF
jgi:hypothetical protein